MYYLAALETRSLTGFLRDKIKALARLHSFPDVLRENPFPRILESWNPLQLLEAAHILWLTALSLQG